MWPIVSAFLAALAFGTLGGVIAYMIKLRMDANSEGDAGGAATTLENAIQKYRQSEYAPMTITVIMALVFAIAAGVTTYKGGARVLAMMN